MHLAHGQGSVSPTTGGGVRTHMPRAGVLAYGLDRPLSGVTRVAQELGRELARQSAVGPLFLVPYRRGPFVGPGYRATHLAGCRLLPGLMAIGPLEIALAARRHRLDVV